MIKKLLLALVSIVGLSCSSDSDYVPPTPSIWLKLTEFEAELKNTYSFSDVSIDVYNTRQDWIAETNALYSAKFDETGELKIENLPESKDYYVDIYTDDDYLSNWGLGSPNSEGDGVIKSNESSRIPIEITLEKEIKTIINDWRFNQALLTSPVFPDEKRSFINLAIQKDFKVIITDSFDGIQYEAIYKIESIVLSRIDMVLVTTSPTNNELFGSSATIRLGEEVKSLVVSYNGMNLEYKPKL